MVWDAAEGLNPPERAVLDLQVRQGLEESEIAQVMGISIDHTYVLTSRMRAGLEKSMAALFIARKGREDCTELQKVLAGWDGAYSPLIRKRVKRHIEQCETCDAKRKRVNPFAVLAGAPAFAAPFALRQRVLGDMQRISFTGDWRADADGFPEASPGTVSRSRWPWLLGAAAALMIIVGLVGFAVSSDDAHSAATDAPTTSATAAPGTTAATTPAVTDTAVTETSTTTATTRPTTTTTVAPTTTAPDRTPPTITSASATPARVAKAECRTSPQLVTVNVTATDANGIAGGNVNASIAGTTYASSALSGSGSTWSAAVGPFPTAAPYGQITLTITVRDPAGNAASTTRTSYLEARCF
jgi:hypothetical protein